MKTPHTDDYVARVAHPIAPGQMRTLVNMLVRDNARGEALEIAGMMVAWSHRAPGNAGDEFFFYWLGVEQTLRALEAGANDRWRARSDAAAARIGRAS